MPTLPEPMRITKRDLEKLKFQRELMRKASLTGPAMMLPGEVLPMVRRFAQETFVQMGAINPGLFRGKTVREWEEAIKKYIMTRRPEFREKMVTQLKTRYGTGPEKGKPSAGTPDILLLGAQGEVEKKSSFNELLHKVAVRLTNA